MKMAFKILSDEVELKKELKSLIKRIDKSSFSKTKLLSLFKEIYDEVKLENEAASKKYEYKDNTPLCKYRLGCNCPSCQWNSR